MCVFDWWHGHLARAGRVCTGETPVPQEKCFPNPNERCPMSAVAVSEKFQSRDELVSFIEETVEKSVPYAATRVDRRLPWVTAGPVCADSAGYSVLKAAAFALG